MLLLLAALLVLVLLVVTLLLSCLFPSPTGGGGIEGEDEDASIRGEEVNSFDWIDSYINGGENT